jgi:hypothetical protein
MIWSFLCLATAQQQSIKPRITTPSVKNDTRPVTCAEGFKVFSEARKLLNTQLKANLPDCTLPRSTSAMTKEQVVAEMCSIRVGLDPQTRFTLKPLKYSAAVLKIGKSEMGNLEALIAGGYVGRVSPLATSPRDSLTLFQFGDALGFFLSRTAEVTHLPSSKWSPNLGAGTR